jgi:phage repressor protein C with HTH and peptisase S24 domain
MPSLSTPKLDKNRHSSPQEAVMAESVNRKLFISRLKTVIDLFGGNSGLARKIGSAESSIRRWASGIVEPKYDSLLSIAQAADISVEWLMTGKGEMRASGFVPTTNAEHLATSGELRSQSIATIGSDNMEPTLCIGDEIGIEDTSLPLREVVSGIYMLKIDGTKGVWRLQKTVDKKLWILNDNPKYHQSNASINLETSQGVEIVAKVIWVRHIL